MQTALIMCTLLFGHIIKDYDCTNNCFITSKHLPYPHLYNVKHIYHRESLGNKINCNGHPNAEFLYSMEPKPFAITPGVKTAYMTPISFRNVSLGIAYGRLIKRQSAVVIPEKKFKVCWIVSNLNPKQPFVAQRLALYKNLSHYIEIKTFGLIRNFRISKKMYTDIIAACTFYLSFENADEENYVTEKFWTPLSLKTIPITFPKTQKEYEQLVPPGAFIHYTTFSPQELASYINLVHKHKFLQQVHLNWHSKFAVEQSVMGKDHLCKLC